MICCCSNQGIPGGSNTRFDASECSCVAVSTLVLSDSRFDGMVVLKSLLNSSVVLLLTNAEFTVEFDP